MTEPRRAEAFGGPGFDPYDPTFDMREVDAIAQDPTPEAEALRIGAELAAAGWRQKSRKYRLAVHVPPGASALAELARVHPAAAERVRIAAEAFAEREARNLLWHDGEKRALSPRVFRAFRAACAAIGVLLVGCGGIVREPAPDRQASAAWECAEIAECRGCAVVACGNADGDRYEARVDGAALAWACSGVADCSAAQQAAADACGVDASGGCPR